MEKLRTFEDNDEHVHHPLNERRYLKALIPLSLRRSVSLEDLSNVDIKSNYFPNRNGNNLTSSTLSSSLQSLCVQLRPHQLLEEFNATIAKSDREHKFDWWKTIAHLRPLIEINSKVISKMTNTKSTKFSLNLIKVKVFNDEMAFAVQLIVYVLMNN